MLAFIEFFNKIGSYANMLERKKAKKFGSFLVRYGRTYVLNKW